MKNLRLFATLFLTIIILMLISMAFISCKGTKTLQHEVIKSDSSAQNNSVKQNTFDSAYYNKQVTEKKLEKATADLTATKEQVIELMTALKNAPPGTTIIKADPKLQALLTITLDSLGNFRFRCESAERTYNETIITQGRVIKSLRDSLAETNRIIRQSETKVVEPKRTFWEWLDHLMKNGLLLAILALVIVVLIMFKPKRK